MSFRFLFGLFSEMAKLFWLWVFSPDSPCNINEIRTGFIEFGRDSVENSCSEIWVDEKYLGQVEKGRAQDLCAPFSDSSPVGKGRAQKYHPFEKGRAQDLAPIRKGGAQDFG